MHAHTFPRPVDSSANLLLLFMSISSCCYFSVFSSVCIKNLLNKKREKKRKMNGVEIDTRAYVATRLLLRWDYLYAVTLKTKVFGDYNHARLEVSWITSTRGLLLRGYTGMNAECIWRSISIQYVQIEPGVNSDLGNGSFCLVLGRNP